MAAEGRPAMRHRRLLAALFVVSALAACDAPTVPAARPGYDPDRLTGDDSTFYHWAPGRTIALYVDPRGVPEGYDLAASARVAASRWAGRTFYREYEFAFVQSPGQADVIIHYRFTPRLVDVFDCDAPGSAPGETTFCPDVPIARVLPLLAGGGGRVKVDVAIDPLGPSELQLTQARQTRQEYVATLIAHELGHVLGLGTHSDEVDDLMHAFPRVASPSLDDVWTLRYILRQRADILL